MKMQMMTMTKRLDWPEELESERSGERLRDVDEILEEALVVAVEDVEEQMEALIECWTVHRSKTRVMKTKEAV
jgi:hypothetical protein